MRKGTVPLIHYVLIKDSSLLISHLALIRLALRDRPLRCLAKYTRLIKFHEGLSELKKLARLNDGITANRATLRFIIMVNEAHSPSPNKKQINHLSRCTKARPLKASQKAKPRRGDVDVANNFVKSF